MFLSAGSFGPQSFPFSSASLAPRSLPLRYPDLVSHAGALKELFLAIPVGLSLCTPLFSAFLGLDSTPPFSLQDS